MSRRKKRDSFSEINITPLTDIFLVLLIIMMVIAPMLDQQGLSLMVPTNSEVKNPKESKLITVNVSKQNEYSIDGKKVAQEELLNKIKKSFEVKKDGLLIQASDDAEHHAVVTVMDAARSAGILSISVTELN